MQNTGGFTPPGRFTPPGAMFAMDTMIRLSVSDEASLRKVDLKQFHIRNIAKMSLKLLQEKRASC